MSDNQRDGSREANTPTNTERPIFSDYNTQSFPITTAAKCVVSSGQITLVAMYVENRGAKNEKRVILCSATFAATDWPSEQAERVGFVSNLGGIFAAPPVAIRGRVVVEDLFRKLNKQAAKAQASDAGQTKKASNQAVTNTTTNAQATAATGAGDGEVKDPASYVGQTFALVEGEHAGMLQEVVEHNVDGHDVYLLRRIDETEFTVEGPALRGFLDHLAVERTRVARLIESRLVRVVPVEEQPAAAAAASPVVQGNFGTPATSPTTAPISSSMTVEEAEEAAILAEASVVTTGAAATDFAVAPVKAIVEDGPFSKGVPFSQAPQLLARSHGPWKLGTVNKGADVVFYNTTMLVRGAPPQDAEAAEDDCEALWRESAEGNQVSITPVAYSVTDGYSIIWLSDGSGLVEGDYGFLCERFGEELRFTRAEGSRYLSVSTKTGRVAVIGGVRITPPEGVVAMLTEQAA